MIQKSVLTVASDFSGFTLKRVSDRNISALLPCTVELGSIQQLGYIALVTYKGNLEFDLLPSNCPFLPAKI